MEKLTLPLTALAGVGVAAWSTQEKALTSMNAALAAGGLDVEAYGKKFEKIASDIQKFTVIGDEAILQNEQFALSLAFLPKRWRRRSGRRYRFQGLLKRIWANPQE